MDKFEEDLREILAQSKHKSSGAERFVQASLAENKYPKDFLIYFINSECFGDYESELPAYEAWQHQQAKVEELQQENLRLAYGNTSYYNQAVKQNEIIDELQKRVDKALELMQKPVIVGEPAKYVCARFKEIEQALKGEG
ncbi:hypothetical protein [Acinetobacter baumannii]|uniref:hypothetical protein n=1 Tax=Acinetobacter baumannii TaxID=470 RepID=UPI00234019F9|nr:hypothetical protein [Acinetobacter baumannii]MDC4013825.1 hypothetical protein [Acinetobacter baumannii]MDC4016622.1 hypothetical protein [Acinetobacter baumannii]MDC4035978.1 hypothetical protein [Acinetobacter baumannii]MDC4039649.1 hypothetical protein [Acinetobacter baumannii]MDC4051975.1 hypothetical protein [Acinetobacter baumannii]